MPFLQVAFGMFRLFALASVVFDFLSLHLILAIKTICLLNG